jgi:type IV secretory pathway VirB2 component (pilin)
MHVQFIANHLLLATSTGVDLKFSGKNGLPGTTVLEGLASGVGHWALIASVVGVIIGGIMWAFGHFSHNYQQSYNGRRGLIVSALAALLIGGANQIITFFFTQGGNIH